MNKKTLLIITTNKKKSPAIPWYLSGGISAINCIGAYQGKGAASYDASKINLANPGTYDLIDTGHVPSTWSSDNGWSGETGKYLATGITPLKTWTIAVRYANHSAGTFAGSKNGTTWSHFIGYSGGTPGKPLRFYNGVGTGTYYIDYADDGTSTCVLSGRKHYQDGTPLGTINDSDYTQDIAMVLLGRMNNTTFEAPLVGNLLACAIYDISLNDTQVAALTTAMAAL